MSVFATKVVSSDGRLTRIDVFAEDECVGSLSVPDNICEPVTKALLGVPDGDVSLSAKIRKADAIETQISINIDNASMGMLTVPKALTEKFINMFNGVDVDGSTDDSGEGSDDEKGREEKTDEGDGSPDETTPATEEAAPEADTGSDDMTADANDSPDDVTESEDTIIEAGEGDEPVKSDAAEETAAVSSD